MVSLVALAAINSQASLISSSGFSNTTGLVLSGNATALTTSDGVVLRLSPASADAGGSVFSLGTMNATDFSSFFQFRMTEPGGFSPQGADGIVFVVQPVSSSLGTSGGGIGYQGVSPSVGVEFDNYMNLFGPNNNHVALMMNGIRSSVLAEARLLYAA